MDNLRQKFFDTAIGFAGIDGAWWLPATRPFCLPQQAQAQLTAIGDAFFALIDAVSELYGTQEAERTGLNALLRHKVPAHLLRFLDINPVYALRPDFQILSPLQFSATELEISPSAQGFAHAMQVGYGLEPDMVPAMARFLEGRTLLIVGSEQWSEFLIEQLAFCRALEEVGAKGRVLYDRPIKELIAEFEHGQRWQPPIFGVPCKTPSWQPTLSERLRRDGLWEYLWSEREEWPEMVGDVVVFRFGYLECFSTDALEQMEQWQEMGTTFLNPIAFFFENKALLAAKNDPAVCRWIDDKKLIETLDACIPDTLLITEETLPRILAERTQWVLKYAGFDQGNQAWGGRSLQIGTQHCEESWRDAVHHYLHLPFPTVAQRLTPSLNLDVEYLDDEDNPQLLRAGNTRLRTFLLRSSTAGRAIPCGSHITVSSGTLQVSEGVDAVQMPVVFT